MAKTAKTTARVRAEQARRERERAARRARRVRTAWWAIAAGPAFVVLLLLIKVSIPGPDSGGGDESALSPAVIAGLDPAASLLDGVGRGAGVTLPAMVDGQPPLVEGGKPLVLYVGAEYCPYCASQRWALVIALNRFGSFTGLTGIRSAETNTATVSFHGATYTSDYLAFNGVELRTRDGDPLDTLTPAQQQVFDTYNAPPYTDARGSVPFLSFGNRFLQTGAAYSPLLLGDMDQDAIVQTYLSDPSGQVGQALLGTANAFTAILCALTNGQPGDVCTTTAATAYQQEVGNA